MASDQNKRRLRGVYLVPDPLMLKPDFGPSEHIRVGLRELQKYFDIEILVLGEYKPSLNGSVNSRSLTKGVATTNGFVGLLRDLKLLYKSNRHKEKLKKELSKRNVDFIYERGQYLDLRGVMAARELRINHFYEVNWLNFLGIKQFYLSWFNSLARSIEEWSYRKSTLSFFIGTQHRLIDIPLKKVHTIQNGIHEELIENNRDHKNIPAGKIKICYVANLMPHHRFDVFLKALKIAQVEDKVELHMIGYHFEEFKKELPAGLINFMHGPVKKKDLPGYMRNCNVGLISGGPSYSSFMKLFEYAAFKMCVICPDLENICLMFSSDEIIYFNTDDPESLAIQLRKICSNHDLITSYGDNIYKKVKEHYTWERIYEDVNVQIHKVMS